MSRSLLFASVLLSTCLLSACGVKVRVQEEAPGLAQGLRPGAVVAVVGVGVAPGVGRFAPVDAADAAEALFADLLGGAPQLAVWSAPATADQLGAATVDSLLADHGRLGALPAARVRSLQARIPGVSYLVIARLEDDEIATETAPQGLVDPEAKADGQPEQESPLMLGAGTTRKLTVSLTFVDLSDGGTAWRGEARASERIRYEYTSPDVDPAAIARETQGEPASQDDLPIITRAGDIVRAPDIVALLGRAFRELIGDLPTATKGKP